MLLVASVVPVAVAKTPPPASHTLATNTQFFTPQPDKNALKQVVSLIKAKDAKDAFLVGSMALTPQAVWLNGGTPAAVQKTVKQTVNVAAAMRTVPILVAYNIPFRDCSQFSAGGAADATAYAAWIDGIAKGIGNNKAVVILEPDSLGIIPFNTDINGNAEWCQPKDADGNPMPGADPATRYAELNAAVDRLELQPNVSVYLDAGHSDWLGVGDNADRLIKAGVAKTQGFYLNASNYQYSPNLVQYGTWISECIATGNPAGCPNQYWNGGPDGSAIAALIGSWNGVSLISYGVWSDTSTDPTLNTSGINARYTSGSGTTHFVIDSSRNAVGPWNPTPYSKSVGQDWCNPPARGVGIRPTANTGVPLLDAYMWIKTPGQSDGACNRWATGGTVDPARGNIQDPAAGVWFPQVALELAKNADPAFKIPSYIK